MSNPYDHDADASSWSPDDMAQRPPRRETTNGSLPSGSGLSKYRILERIRSTYNATVYKARDTLLDRLVSIKQMTNALIDNPMACGDFRREAQMMARFTGDARHVIGIHELIEDQQGLFIVHEYVDGRWLESLIAKREIDGDRALRVFGTLALGIRTLHGLGLVHRDIRPSNVMVAPGLGAKIVDLSSAAAEGDCSPPPTRLAKYCAPEFLLGEAYDDRIDVYSFGMVMYEILVGRQAMHEYFAALVADPRKAENRWREWHCEMDLTLPLVHELNPSIPRPLSVLVARMTAKAVEDRCASINEVIETLTRFLRDRRMDSDRRLPGRSSSRGAEAALPPPATAGANRLLTDSAGPFGAFPAGIPATTQTWSATGPMPAVPRTLGPAHAAVSAGPKAGDLASLRLAASTTTHRVASAGASTVAGERREETPVWMPEPSTLTTRREATSPLPARVRHRKPVATLAKPRVATIANVPTPEPVEEIHKEINYRRRIAVAAMVTLAIGLAGVGGYGAYQKYGPAREEPIKSLIASGAEAFGQGDLDAAKTTFEQARLDAGVAGADALRDSADHWLYLIAAARELKADRLAEAEERLRLAENHGAEPLRVEELRQKIYRKKDEKRLIADIEADLGRGDLTAAERRLDPYEQSAGADLVAERYRERIKQARSDGKYGEQIAAAKAQMQRQDYTAALVSVNKAKAMRPGQEAEDLERRILDWRQRDEYISRGDSAMLDGDFDRAVDLYELANRKEPSPLGESRAKEAKSHQECQRAKKALDRGEILLAGQCLRNAIWGFPQNTMAQTMYNSLQPALAAAELERQADEDLERGRFDDAIATHERAIPALPAPANGRARASIVRAQQGKIVAEGDAAYQKREYSKALAAYQRALQLGETEAIKNKITRARAKLEN